MGAKYSRIVFCTLNTDNDDIIIFTTYDENDDDKEDNDGDDNDESGYDEAQEGDGQRLQGRGRSNDGESGFAFLISVILNFAFLIFCHPQLRISNCLSSLTL